MVTHISGVLVESMLLRENLVLTMITGLKQRRLQHKTDRNPAATSSERT